MAIKLEFSFHAPTFIGYAFCNYTDVISDNYRDITNVEHVISLVKKFFNQKNASGQCMDFAFRTLETGYTICSRIYKNYDGSFDYHIWNGVGAGTDARLDKLTTKHIREFYLSCANLLIDLEEQEARKAKRVGA